MSDRAQHRWKVSTFVLLFVLGGLVVAKKVAPAEAQMKTVPRPVPVLGGGDSQKKMPPAQLAVKLLEGARTLALRAPPDAGGHRNKSIQLIDLALSEAKALGSESEGPVEVPRP